MTKLTKEIKHCIEINSGKSNRQLSTLIEEIYQITVSHVAVGNYKKKYLESMDVSKSVFLERKVKPKNTQVQAAKMVNGYMNELESIQLFKTLFKLAQNRGTKQKELRNMGVKLVKAIYLEAKAET